MNQSDIRMRQNLCRRLSAARRRQKYEPGLRNVSMFSNCGVISKTAAHGAMDGKEDEEVGSGQDWIWFDVEKEYGEEEYDIFGHIMGKSIEKRVVGGSTSWRGDGRQSVKKQLDMATVSQLAVDQGKDGVHKSESQQRI